MGRPAIPPVNRLHVEHEGVDRRRGPQRHHGQVDAAQAQRRQPDHDPDRDRAQAGQDEREREADAPSM